MCMPCASRRPSRCWKPANDSVEAIANEVGYEDTSFFSRMFRRKVGIAPGKYRLRFGALRSAAHGSVTGGIP